MRKLLCFFTAFLSFLIVASAADKARPVGDVTVTADNKTIPVRVSASTAELNALAQQAFNAHGRYRVVAGGHAYNIRFSPSGGNQVRVDITRGSAATPVASDVASGTSLRHALLKAADIAVVKTNGLGLKGFFTSKLTFIRENGKSREVYISDLFLGEAQEVTHDRAPALMPRWSPDGSKIIYTSYFKSGFPDIFLLDLASRRRDTFVSFKGTNQGARFSPNGQQVAMVLSGTGTPEIWVSNAQGRGVVRKTRSDAVKSSPCFSPDGSRLIFASEPGPQLYIMPVSGGTPQRVTREISGYCAEPDWSRADPNKIAFTIREGRNYQIAVLDLSTRASKKVSAAQFDGVEPCWLPDGRHLVYTARGANESVLCILDTETGKSKAISPASFGKALQANVWAP